MNTRGESARHVGMPENGRLSREMLIAPIASGRKLIRDRISKRRPPSQTLIGLCNAAINPLPMEGICGGCGHAQAPRGHRRGHHARDNGASAQTFHDRKSTGRCPARPSPDKSFTPTSRAPRLLTSTNIAGPHRDHYPCHSVQRCQTEGHSPAPGTQGTTVNS